MHGIYSARPAHNHSCAASTCASQHHYHANSLARACTLRPDAYALRLATSPPSHWLLLQLGLQRGDLRVLEPHKLLELLDLDLEDVDRLAQLVNIQVLLGEQLAHRTVCGRCGRRPACR